jgi:mono/diheme cytochrome c family protein
MTGATPKIPEPSVLRQLVSASLMVLFGTTFAAAESVRSTGAIDKGRSLYASHCASCHGAHLEGEPNWRRRKANGRLPAPPHNASGHTWHHPAEQLFQITKYGTEKIVGNFYKSDMLGFDDALSDDQIRAVLAFIESTWPEKIRKGR